MANFARVINDVAADVSSNPAEQFHPSIAAEFRPMPDEVRQGWRLVSGTWTEPAPVEPSAPAVEYPKVSPVEFKLLFTPQERVAIKAARASDPAIDDFFDIVEDPRLTYVDLGLESTKQAVQYLASKNLITSDRVAQILSGMLK